MSGWFVGRARALRGQFLGAAVALDEVGQQRAQVLDLWVAEALAQLVLHRVALSECAGADALAGATQPQARSASVGGVAGAFEVAQRDHVIREPARALFGDAEHHGQARHGRLLGRDGAEDEAERGPHRAAARGGDRLAETVRHAAVGGGDEDREVRLAHAAQGGANVGPSGTMVACPPTGMHATARKGSSPGTWKVKVVPPGRMRQSPGPSGWLFSSLAATA